MPSNFRISAIEEHLQKPLRDPYQCLPMFSWHDLFCKNTPLSYELKYVLDLPEGLRDFNTRNNRAREEPLKAIE